MSKEDYYKTLNISRDSGAGEIKKAYRQAAMKYHPDRNPGDSVAEEKFKAASEAYEVLSDPQKRQIYDQYGHQGLSGQGFQGFHDVGDIFSSFGSIFEEFFGFSGGGRGSRAPQRGSDLRYDMQIEFLEAVFGVEKEITFDRLTTCQTCEGSRAAPGSQPITCRTCSGAGQVRRSQGFFSIATTCPTCHGEGQEISKPCSGCRGRGVETEHKTLSVKIPGGVETGVKLRVTGEGEAGPGGRSYSGDLYVVLHVKEDPKYVRDGYDVIVEKPISMVQAALGCKIEIPLLKDDETKVIHVEPGTQFGHRITIAGEGIPKLRGAGRGDFIVQLKVEVPKKLSRQQRELLEQFAEASGVGVDGASQGGGFLHRIFSAD